MDGYFHSVKIAPERCTGNMACLKVCPTEAIRVRRGKAVMLEDRCIDCGECARRCARGAIVPQTSSFTDFARFQYTVALISPVLYGQLRKDVLPRTIVAALRKIGFDEACDVACASEAVSTAVDEYLAGYRGPLPLLWPFCPTIVRLIGETKTKTGLRINCGLTTEFYPTKIKVSDVQMAELDLVKHPILPNWNYTLLPRINRN